MMEVNGLPRQAVLMPAHAAYRLQNQRFDVGDRVVMVKDSGSVPLSAKGVVIGVNQKMLEVVWDIQLMSGSTLGNRCATHSNRSTGKIVD
jgi:5'-3' exoribonuclease 1